MALAPMALRLDSCLPRAIISISGRSRGELRGKLDEAIALRADGGAEAGHDVRDIAELLQDGVVGNGAHARRSPRSATPPASLCRFTGREPVLNRRFGPKAPSSAR